jgi:hypothetical protein
MASRAERYRLWREHLKRLAASGLSREVYCAFHGLSRSTLYRWERRLRGEPIRPRVSAAFEEMEWIAVRVTPDANGARWSELLRGVA